MNLLVAILLFGPALQAENLVVQAWAADYRIAFRVPADATVDGAERLEHTGFECWRGGVKLDPQGHEVGFSQGPWGYMLWIRPSAAASRISLFNHTLIGGISTQKDAKVRFRPGWYRYSPGQTLGLKGAPARLEIADEVETPAYPRRASSLALLLAALLGAALLTVAADRPGRSLLRHFRPPARW